VTDRTTQDKTQVTRLRRTSAYAKATADKSQGKQTQELRQAQDLTTIRIPQSCRPRIRSTDLDENRQKRLDFPPSNSVEQHTFPTITTSSLSDVFDQESHQGVFVNRTLLQPYSHAVECSY